MLVLVDILNHQTGVFVSMVDRLKDDTKKELEDCISRTVVKSGSLVPDENELQITVSRVSVVNNKIRKARLFFNENLVIKADNVVGIKI